MRPLILLALLSAAAAAQPAHESDVIYGRKHGMALTLDLFRPQKPNRAAVIFVVSSGWFSSHQAIRPTRYGAFLKRGYAVFAVVHGSTPRFTIPEAVADVNRAVRFVRHEAKRFEIDGDRIGIVGLSAGGHLALMISTAGTPGDPTARDPVARESSRVQAVAAFFPPTDFLHWGKPERKVTDSIVMQRFFAPFDFHTYDRRKNAYIPIKDPEEIRKRMVAISPAEQVTPDDPPTLLIHGEKDPLVPLQQSRLMLATLQKAGVETRLIVKEGKRHGWRGLGEDLATVAEWFDGPLKKKE